MALPRALMVVLLAQDSQVAKTRMHLRVVHPTQQQRPQYGKKPKAAEQDIRCLCDATPAHALTLQEARQAAQLQSFLGNEGDNVEIVTTCTAEVRIMG